MSGTVAIDNHVGLLSAYCFDADVVANWRCLLSASLALRL